MRNHRYYIIAAAILLASASPAYAYIGPGPGLSMLGSLFTLIGGILLALVMVLLWPIRLLIRRIKGQGKRGE